MKTATTATRKTSKRRPGAKTSKRLTNADVYRKVTDVVLTLLDKGVAPWRKTWNGPDSAPANLISKKSYRGINPFILHATALANSYSSRWWLTFKQARDLGGNVRKGEKATTVVFWSIREKEVVDPKTSKKGIKKLFMLRYFSVFNLEQTEGIDESKVPAPSTVVAHDPIESAEVALNSYVQGETGPMFNEVDGDRAFYVPALDTINVPRRKFFGTVEEFYATAFHEATHSTGHKSRLDRLGGPDQFSMQSHAYSFEELIAELGSAFCCASTGIESTVENSAAYLAHWRSKLDSNPDWIVKAAGKAAKASDLILGIEQEKYES